MPISPTFYRVAAVCSWLSVVTTLGLIFLPWLYAPADGFDGRMARVHDPAYQLRAWLYLLHPFLVFTAALAVAVRLRATRLGWAALGLAAFALWAATEAGQQALTLMTFDRWRVAYAGADAAWRAALVERVAWYDALWDSMYFLIVVAFALANAAYAVALAKGARLDRVLAAFYLAACALTLAIISAEVGGPALPDALGFWLYPLIQPLGRALIGVWLWRRARELT